MSMKKKIKLTQIAYFASFSILVFSVIIFLCSIYGIPTNYLAARYPEINYLESHIMNFEQLKDYFKELSIRKGGKYSYEVLHIAPVPYGVDMHLLAHVVGDELYKQKGIKGMKDCTDDFRNACSHSLVINLFYEKGEESVKDIVEACKLAPGTGAYGMCYHGLGHGVFAYTGYEFSKTTELCKSIANWNLNGPEFKECIGGAVMEQISGGDHDKVTWGKKRLENLSKEEPLNLCLNNLSDDPEVKKICLIYITPFLWEAEGRRAFAVSGEVLVNSFQHCNGIPFDNPQYRSSCFGGFGKEFLVMARGKDVRHIDKMTEGEMLKIYHWCLLAPALDGHKSCIEHAQGSMYWSGANDKSLPERFCRLAPSEELRNHCFEGLINAIKTGGKKSIKYLHEFCLEVPASLQQRCRIELSLKS